MRDRTSPVPDLAAVPALSPANPLTFLDNALTGVRQYHAVMAALDLGLFEIFREPKSGPVCAQVLGCRPEIVTLLCDGLVTLGLLEKGHTVRIISRSPDKARELVSKGARLFEGDLYDVELLKRAFSRADAV